MKKSFSCKNFTNININNKPISTTIRKCLSTTSLNVLPFSDIIYHNIYNNIYDNTINTETQLELVLLSNYPINNIISCSIDNNNLLTNKILDNKDKQNNNYKENNINYIKCVETPYNEENCNEKIKLSKNYLELSCENNLQKEKYIKWISRIRKKRKKE